MKYLFFLAAGLLFCAALFAGDNPQPVINLSLLTSGSAALESKEKSDADAEGLLYNRGDLKISFLSSGLALRGEILDRRPLIFGSESNPLFGDSEKWVTNFLGAMYHSTGSRFLFGVLDEWGLSARIRNPWIRSPPFPENHKPLISDFKTTVSVTKNDEVYLYLTSPFLNISRDVKLRGFISAQTEIDDIKPAFSGGAEFKLPKKTGVLFETFFTGAVLPPTKNSSWFTTPPPLPEREFRLYSAGLLFHNQLLAVSSDWALSETFAWGAGFYGNFGVTLTPLLSSGRIARPLSIAFSADGAGERFVYRDGANHGEGFRSAVKVEWKGKGSSLLRLNTTLRAPGSGREYNRSSTGFYYRFPARRAGDESGFPVRLTRISFTADRNAADPQKISDKFTGYAGFSLDLGKIGIKTPFGFKISGSVNGLSHSNTPVSPFPVPEKSRITENSAFNCEFTWSPLNLQFVSKAGFTNNYKKDEKVWDFSFSTAARFRHGRLSIKSVSPNFPDKWNWTVSWRMETEKQVKF